MGGGGGFKALLQLANFTLGPDATLNTEIHKNSVRIKAPNSVNASKRTCNGASNITRILARNVCHIKLYKHFHNFAICRPSVHFHPNVELVGTIVTNYLLSSNAS